MPREPEPRRYVPTGWRGEDQIGEGRCAAPTTETQQPSNRRSSSGLV